ncbi:MAG: hypothetical protein KJZ79_23615 [Bryobacteraceae bacterium]|nr:hypothetical protein [Bryobacteraceae bacterium]
MRHLFLLSLAAALLPAAPPPPIEWEATTAILGGHTAIVKLDSGARIEGAWLGVTPTTFTMDVKRAKGKNRPAKGVQTIGRSAIVELRVRRHRIRGRGFGVLTALFLTPNLILRTSSVPAIWTVCIGVGVAPIIAGAIWDHSSQVVHIKPES